ncbi:MAG: DNA recombination protein RmuC [Bradyrhizobium sp.]|nr:MAG: DNA recombination protein RmuC [Bradyrhizobium sp.]
MNPTLAVFYGYPVTFAHALGAIALLLLLLLLALWRANAARRRDARAAEAGRRELEARLGGLAQSNAELAGRLGSMSEWLGSRQADLARVMSERLDNVGARLGVGLEAHAQTTGANLNKLNERLAVIDAAQARIVGMTQEVVSLKDILANKQTRGAFGQGRMESIVSDGLPAGAYEFQATLSNKARPDCVIRLPGDTRVLAVDAKFPLEGFTLFNEARGDEARKAATARVRADIGKHVKDIAERYLLPGETQDIALMFVPSESIYSDLVEHFDDVIQKAHRLRVVIVSPSLMMMAIQVTQAILRDHRMRDQAQTIHAEVGRLLNDVRLLAERTTKLETHFRQAQEDVGMIATSAEKVTRRAARIDSMGFGEDAVEAPPPNLRLAQGGD